MGIEVSNHKEVSFNSSHEDLLDTSVAKNPTLKYPQAMTVQFIFKRKRTKTHHPDGSPFIYALKGILGYSITTKEILKFRSNFYQILDKAANGKIFSTVVFLPSSSRTNLYFARRVARKFNAQLVENIFIKKTVGEVITDLENLGTLTGSMEKERIMVLHNLRKSPAGKPFAMKEVRNKNFRKRIQPLKVANISAIGEGPVLLVDDLYASGSSLACARILLINQGVESDIEAICLCSGL